MHASMALRRLRPAPAAAPAPPSLHTLLVTAEAAARSSTIDELADAVVAGVADLLGATRCTLLKAAPELLMPLGTGDRGPLLDAELQVAGAVMRTQEARFVTQIAHRIASPGETAASEIEVSTLALPLVAGSDLVGVLVATWDDFESTPDAAQTEAARVIASIAGLAMERTLLGQQAAKLHEVDPLTGTGSRDSLIALLDVLRDRGTLHSIVILDIDGFREHNRKHGRAHGDRLLTALAAMISRECRDGDALVRSGSDEFSLVLPGSSVEAGTATARRIVSAVADWGHEDGVTVSAGVASMTSQADADVLSSAMEALAEAKAAGTGRIAVN
jgi:diguanylate cyclase (GGDEF)-like protein